MMAALLAWAELLAIVYGTVSGNVVVHRLVAFALPLQLGTLMMIWLVMVIAGVEAETEGASEHYLAMVRDIYGTFQNKPGWKRCLQACALLIELGFLVGAGWWVCGITLLSMSAVCFGIKNLARRLAFREVWR